MITEAVLQAMIGTVEFLLGLLPDDNVPWPNATTFGAQMGALVGPIDSILPMVEFVTVTTITLTIVLPALIIYRLAMWLWMLLPFT